ncbi:efflux RND transporter permease subunit [Alkaliphilus transvaalensis]|uniref:efflux RND transporter permease subunit n=1 Tax=Alkaliphilus transvaalensis TaxID=114628 RepID=UPI00047E8730|nr:efflux RND transporter permease subunit [Alkaliphilus transvaalensis]
MKIISWAVKKSVSVIMLMALIILLGSVSIFRLSMDLLPKINVPVALVNIQYPGAGPHEIENLITRPIEEAVATVHNIKRINSTSSEGSATVVIEFNQDTDMDFATLEMRERIDLVKNYLPEDAQAPIILKIDPNALPIMTLGVGGQQDLSQLQEITENRIKPRLERLEGVASVSITGGYQERVEIVVDPAILQSYGITVDQLSGIIKAENINLPAGEVFDGESKRLFRTMGEFETIDELKELPIPLPTAVTVPLSALASVNLTTGELQEIARMDGQESIRITLQKQSVANTVRVANRVNEEIKLLNEEINGVEIKPIIDQSTYIKNSIANVGKTAIYGGILAVIVLFLFLRNYRSTIIIALAIPISVLATFCLMFFFDMTLNLLSLGGFALGVGMLVDNGIVVTENIHRFREEGNDAEKSSIRGAQEVAMAVTASTLTTLAVFLPIVFVEGMTAQIFKELALTVTFALLASLLISLTLVPMLSSRILEKELPVEGNKRNFIFRGFDKGMEITHHYYKKILRKSLKQRPLVLIIALAIFLASVGILMQVGAEYFPAFDEGTFTINVMLPHGSTLQQTEEVVSEIEAIVKQYEEVEALFTNIGGSDGLFHSQSKRSNRASIDGKLVPQGQRKQKTNDLVDDIRRDLKIIAGAEINITSTSSIMSMGFGGTSLELEIRGDDLDELNRIANDFTAMIEEIEGTREVESNYIEGPPQIGMKINRYVTSRYGLQAFQVGSIARMILQGATATRLKIDGRELEVVIKGEPYLQESIGNFMQVAIASPLGVAVPLEELVTVQSIQGPTSIRRVDQVRAITIEADIINRDLNSVISEIEGEINDYSLPAGYTYRFRGEQEQLVEAFESLILVVILAILLVYMILAAQFQSLLHPFTIMFSVPLAFSGGAIGLLVAGRPLSVPAMIGAVVLAGIVVNNGIVLIDYINILRLRGNQREEAIITAGYTRLRPILMTTFTTILGLIPLAIGMGEGAEAQAPMATVVIGGLLSATILTLVVIPVIYTIFDDLKMKFQS